MPMNGPWKCSVMVALLVAAAVWGGCDDCDFMVVTLDFAPDDAEACGYASDLEAREEVFECMYAAIDEGRPAWAAFDSASGPFAGGGPSPKEGAVVFDGESTVSGLYRYSSCQEFGVVGPCVTSTSCEATGDFNHDPDTPHGPGHIGIETDSCTLEDAICS